MVDRVDDVTTTESILRTKQSVQLPVPPKNVEQKGAAKGVSFKDMLKHRIEPVRFSGHAQERLAARNIILTAQELSKIEVAVDRASQKGARASLILLNDLALIVSIQNRTVITVMDGSSMKENVFTNIDSAVIV